MGIKKESLSYTSYLIVAFVFFIIVLLLFGLVLVRIITFPNPPETLDPEVVFCDPSQVLDAWIRNTPNKINCPPWTNNLVVADNYILYEKFFQAQGDCCWFSNIPEQRSVVSQPVICIVKNKPAFIPQYTLEELNQKPYFQNGNQISFPIPACDSDPSCVSFVRKEAGTDITRYVITKYNNQVVGEDPFSNEFILRSSFVLGDECVGLKSIYVDSVLIGTVVNGKVVYNIPIDPKPQVLIDIEKIFLVDPGRAYPIPGQNPVLAG